MMKVKTFYHGHQSREEKKRPITHETIDDIKLQLHLFNKWLLQWKENPNMKGLSRPTFNAFN